MCTRGIPDTAAAFSIEAAYQEQKQQPRRPLHRGRPGHIHCLVQSGSTYSNCTTDRILPLPGAKRRSPRDNLEWLRQVESARVPLGHAPPSPQTPANSLDRIRKAQQNRPPDVLINTLVKTRKGLVARMEDTGLPKCVIFEDLVRGAVSEGMREGGNGQGAFWANQSFQHLGRPVDDHCPGRGRQGPEFFI